MKIEHNSRELFYRTPYGAVAKGTSVTLRLAVEGGGIPNAIHTVVQYDGGEEVKYDMAYSHNIGDFCIYEITLEIFDKVGLVWYWFEVESGSGTVWYGNNSRGLGGKGEMSPAKIDKAYQITVYDEKYKTPDWFKQGVVYQIFPDRFYKSGDFLGKRDDIIKREWNEMPYYNAEQFGGEYKSNDFFGGNLKGIEEKLPYLANLGVTVIYLNPIFKAYSNHRYDTGDYETIDEILGDEEDFKTLCQSAKKQGIRIILDGVFNHTGSNSKYFNKDGEYDSIGAYQSQNSPYYSWFRFDNWPEEYESWWGMKTLPQVEENSEEYRKYLLTDKNSIVKRWIEKGASGWRLDVVDELPDFFVKELRKSVKEVDKDAVIIGEVWEDASNKVAYGERREYFLGDELDSVMNYPMRDALISAVRCEIDACELNERLMSLKENYPREAYYSLLNILSSHDVERILTRMGNTPSRHEVSKDYQAEFILQGDELEKARARVKVVTGLQMTLPGVPCIYYGDEIAMQGYGDPFCRQTYNWGKIDEMYEWYKQLTEIRKNNKSLTDGEYYSVYTIGNVYGFVRICDDEKILVIANMGDNHERVRVDCARYKITSVCCLSGEEISQSENGVHFLDISPVSIAIFKAKQ